MEHPTAPTVPSLELNQDLVKDVNKENVQTKEKKKILDRDTIDCMNEAMCELIDPHLRKNKHATVNQRKTRKTGTRN